MPAMLGPIEVVAASLGVSPNLRSAHGEALRGSVTDSLWFATFPYLPTETPYRR